MNDTVKVTMLVAFYRPDLDAGEAAYPVVVGCINHDTLEVIDQEDEDRIWREMRDSMFGSSEVDYEYRPVDVEIPRAELAKLIQVHTVQGKVLADA